MGNTNPTCENWREAYRAALLEQDVTKLAQRISDARLAIIERIEATLRRPLNTEHQALYSALKGLRTLCEQCEAEAQRNLERNLARSLELRCRGEWQERAEGD
jgi:hypothetical protein